MSIHAPLPRLSDLKYDQTQQYHPFAHATAPDEWVVQPPTAAQPIGVVRSRTADDGSLEFLTFLWHDGRADSEPFDGAHPTLFHAVSWLRWRLGAHA